MAQELNEKKGSKDASQINRGSSGASAEDAEASLWSYATRVYGAPAVARACLRAQDEFGLDVNQLLFAAWLSEYGIALEAGSVTAATDLCADWRSEVVEPLRRTRRSWRESPPHADAYEAIKALELEAERHQLAFLARLGSRIVGLDLAYRTKQESGIRRDLLRANLALIVEPPELLDELLTALEAAR